MYSVFDKEFTPYGKVVEGYDFSDLLKTLEATTEKPSGRVIYTASDPALESLPIFASLQDRLFGGLPIQIGYCNGMNTKLNCLEYHRGSEVCIAADGIILILAKLQDVEDGKLDASKSELFSVPKGTGVLCYETTMHYAPAKPDSPFRTIIVLPRLTNTEKPAACPGNAEDKMLFARNKWLIAHPDAPEAKHGAYVGLTGANIDVARL
jgi:hypothetical protein